MAKSIEVVIKNYIQFIYSVIFAFKVEVEIYDEI